MRDRTVMQSGGHISVLKKIDSTMLNVLKQKIKQL